MQPIVTRVGGSSTGHKGPPPRGGRDVRYTGRASSPSAGLRATSRLARVIDDRARQQATVHHDQVPAER